MSNSFDHLWISISQTLGEAVGVIDSGGAKIALVGTEERLEGIVTDGDVRRALLRGESFASPVSVAMERNYSRLPVGSTRRDALQAMKTKMLHQIPVISADGKLVELHLIDDLLSRPMMGNLAVIMAGGEGKRLRPLTYNCPKPMLRVGGKPILEIILQNCVDSGIGRFLISVNYLKEHIQSYFGDGSKWSVQIDYLEEDKPLGTGGALSLINEEQAEPFFVMNGDVLTSVDFNALLRFHRELEASMTACVRMHRTEIPYGVVSTGGDLITSIEEKPLLSHYINAGVYVVEPRLLHLVPSNQFFDLPDLLDLVLKNNERVAAFPLHEDWLDIGHPETLEIARGKWS